MRGLLIVVVVVLGSACHLAYTGGARPVEPIALDASWIHAAPTPVVRQAQETDCGLAALAMVAGAWGKTWDPITLAQTMPPGDKGVKLTTLRDYARAQGFTAFALAATTKDLRHELESGRPIVLGLMLPYDMKHNRSHYEVAIAYKPADGSVITIDPATGKWMTRSKQVLDAEWKAASYAALVVTGPSEGATSGSVLSTQRAP